MEKLDQLIAKFKEVREDLVKSDSPLHDTVEGFMGGLKAHPKGSPERAKFITAHMGHGPFLHSLNQHPQGKQMHGMLMGHLNAPANAGPKAYGGGKVAVAPPPMTAPGIKKSEEDPLEELEKFYISPYTMFGSRKKAAPAEGPKVPKSTKPTGIDKIKAVSKEKIEPTTIVSEDQKRAKAMGAPTNPTAPKLTGLDRIKAESQKPITATTVKKSLDEVKKAINSPSTPGKMLGGGATKLTHPADMGRANMLHDAMNGAYQPKPVAPPAVVAGKKLTGLDRIRAASAQPIQKDEDDKTNASPPKMNAAGLAAASAGPGHAAPGQVLTGTALDHNGRSLSIPKVGGDAEGYRPVSSPGLNDPANQYKGPVTTAMPARRAAGAGQVTAGAPGMSVPPVQAPTRQTVVSPTVASPTQTLTSPTTSMKPAVPPASMRTGMPARTKRVEMPALKSESPKFTKTINQSYSPETNMVKQETLSLNKGGQWNLNKAECSKCHADPCECQTTGLLVDKTEMKKARSNKPNTCDSCGTKSFDLRDGMCGSCDSTNFSEAEQHDAPNHQLKALPGGAKEAAPSTAKLKVVKVDGGDISGGSC